MGGTWTQQFERGPGLAEGVFKQKLDGTQGYGGGRAGGVFVVVEIEEILAQFLIVDLIG